MGATLGRAQTAEIGIRLTTFNAREPLGGVEVKVMVVDETGQTEEALDGAHLIHRVGNERLAANEMDLLEGEVGQPFFEVLGVQTDAHRRPPFVNLCLFFVVEKHLIERLPRATFAERLGII